MKINKSIAYISKYLTIPLAEVSHVINRHRVSDGELQYGLVIFKHSKVNGENGEMEPNVSLTPESLPAFEKALLEYWTSVEDERINPTVRLHLDSMRIPYKPSTSPHKPPTPPPTPSPVRRGW
ncbi:hypothetical protein B0I27_107100 [Arcticibacter pallidicorallinus]|uniref:Uncharacterized protein n=1 Tax=Arcticibacter pallidicorallinus TaxID=1259464 RepID=A0A2T0U0T0_9SPHI|nr:hypothetical protein [Arcticibacter pallidicorallinus]PRY51514.1 hypothetical protein B0I27_107100 [Arcticibacter pallidicorallinus]